MNKTKNIVVKEESGVSPRFETGLLAIVSLTEER